MLILDECGKSKSHILYVLYLKCFVGYGAYVAAQCL